MCRLPHLAYLVTGDCTPRAWHPPGAASVTHGAGSAGHGLDDRVAGARRDESSDGEPGLAEQRLVTGGCPLPPTGHDEHVQVHPLADVGHVAGCEDQLDDEQLAVVR